MTTIRVSSKDGRITGFTCKGHSGYAEEGSDIVCAAVSALTQTAVNALETVAKVTPEVKVKDGSLEARLPDTENHDAQIILQSMVQGLRDISESYPAFVRLICSNENE
ncbi:MAG: ribosomal-processing cysteine protease Prp [Clostridiales bacterium]|jgi:Predicted ribosomal protein|nr:ribosomal-processing cysteine protease Prp [Clostridiales bacterium]